MGTPSLRRQPAFYNAVRSDFARAAQVAQQPCGAAPTQPDDGHQQRQVELFLSRQRKAGMDEASAHAQRGADARVGGACGVASSTCR